MIVNRNLSSASPKISGRQVSMHLVLSPRASFAQPPPGAPPSVSLPRSSTVLLITRASCTSKKLAIGRYNYANVDALVQRRQGLREGRGCGGVRKKLGEHVPLPCLFLGRACEPAWASRQLFRTSTLCLSEASGSLRPLIALLSSSTPPY